jgi:hypothetical protein
MTSLEIALDAARKAQVNSLLPADPDTREGMAWIFEDNPISKPVAVTTTAFARKFCADDPFYTWRKL